jgi:hypothetical protein
VPPPHSPSPLQPRQVLLPPSQIGLAPPQSVPARQPTQWSVATSHSGRGPAQAPLFPAVHSWQAPLGTQTGVADEQSLDPAHPRQLRVPPSQTGALPPQSPAVKQPTHTTLTVSHNGVAPVQAVAFDPEQVPHAPLAWQAGLAPPHWPSPVQP